MSTKKTTANTKRPRYSGIIAHPTSFPGPYGIGDLGKGAYDFIDFLEKSGQSLWQCLPLGPTGFGDSPYSAYSAFAGQPLIISPELLVKDGLLSEHDLHTPGDFNEYSVNYGAVTTWKTQILHKAFENFKSSGSKELHAAFLKFKRSDKNWLDDFALYMSIREESGHKPWIEWDDEHRNPDRKTYKVLQEKYADNVEYYSFVQFIFYKQWEQLKAYANEKGIQIVGDLPIFVSADSSDVWANKDMFKLDSDGFPTVVAGVPPDYFSATGQLWGNPLYDWEHHKKTGYSWWISRIRQQLTLFDYIRIDHFRGFDEYWEVPAGAENAIGGKWVKGPGADLFKAIQDEFGKDLPLFAEDLGIITPSVEKLRDRFKLPGMKILQFAFEGGESTYLPYMYENDNCICYTGTHDNDTTVGWYHKADDKVKDRVRRYVNADGSNIHWDFIRLALGSIAKYAIFPLQDVLGFGSDCRMNTPGVANGNWAWRYKQEYLNDGLAEHLKSQCEIFGRDRARMKGDGQ